MSLIQLLSVCRVFSCNSKKEGLANTHSKPGVIIASVTHTPYTRDSVYVCVLSLYFVILFCMSLIQLLSVCRVFSCNSKKEGLANTHSKPGVIIASVTHTPYTRDSVYVCVLSLYFVILFCMSLIQLLSVCRVFSCNSKKEGLANTHSKPGVIIASVTHTPYTRDTVYVCVLSL